MYDMDEQGERGVAPLLSRAQQGLGHGGPDGWSKTLVETDRASSRPPLHLLTHQVRHRVPADPLNTMSDTSDDESDQSHYDSDNLPHGTTVHPTCERLKVAYDPYSLSISVVISHPLRLGRRKDGTDERDLYTYNRIRSPTSTWPHISVVPVGQSSQAEKKVYRVVEYSGPPPNNIPRFHNALDDATASSAECFKLIGAAVYSGKWTTGGPRQLNGLHPGELTFECNASQVPFVISRMEREERPFERIKLRAPITVPSQGDPPLRLQ